MGATSETPLRRDINTSLLRFSTAGSVDDGKSTLIGRLLHDSGNVYDDHLASLQSHAHRSGSSKLSLALLTDGLKAEREQGITIDVAYRYFETPRRRFILADSPGHAQYTRNMATGASTADLTIILVDASAGVLEQTKRHAFIAALLGVPRIIVAVNKMDLVDYSCAHFEQIVADFTRFSAKLGIREIKFIPVSALEGDNVVLRSVRMPWYTSETILEYLENVYIAGDHNMIDLRFPIQLVLNPNHTFRGYAGTISSGALRVGDDLVALPSMRRSKVGSLLKAGTGATRLELAEASSREAVVVQLEEELDITRGDMLVRAKNMPRITTTIDAMLVWLGDTPMSYETRYLIRHTTREVKGFVNAVEYRVDVHTLGRTEAAPLSANEIGRINLTTTAPLFIDSYQRNRATGNFILIDPNTLQTVGAGMVLERSFYDGSREEQELKQPPNTLHREEPLVSRAEREDKLGHKAVTLWMTGLSGSGKSTIAKKAERALFDRGVQVFLLDGDNLRRGLSRELGFSKRDRSENLRRAAEVAALLNQAGVSVLCAFISPYESDRTRAREIIGADRFLEVFISAPLETCEQRDPHGLYQKARRGEIMNFTGISDPYETPTAPALVLDTTSTTEDECVERLVAFWVEKATRGPRRS